MGLVIVSNIVSLDGFYEGAGGDVMALPMDPAFDAYNRERIEAASAMLLGRRSYEGFAGYWPGIEHAPDDRHPAHSADNRAISRRYRAIDKTVVSKTFQPEPDHPWNETTTVLVPDDLERWISQARTSDGGDVLIFASRMLWNSLVPLGLVDELHLMVGAAILAEGTPISDSPIRSLSLIDVRHFETSDNVVVSYRLSGSDSSPDA